MRLVYIWINQYSCFTNQGFSFSSKYEIEFGQDKAQVTIRRKGDDIGALLYGNNLDITAIVGNNGAGKSTLLDFIRIFFFAPERIERERMGFVILEEEPAGKGLEIYDYMPGEITFLAEGSFGALNCHRKKILYDNPGKRFPDLIFYSDLLDRKYYLDPFDDGEGFESVSYFEDTHIYDKEEEEWISVGDSPLRSWVQFDMSLSHLAASNFGKRDSVRALFHQDVKRQILFYKKLKNFEKYKNQEINRKEGQFQNYIPFQIPKHLKIVIDILDMELFDKVLDRDLLSYDYPGNGHKGEINTDSFTIGFLKQMKRVYDRQFTSRNRSVFLPDLNFEKILSWDLLVTLVYNLLSGRMEQGDLVRDEYDYVDECLEELFEGDLPGGEDLLARMNQVWLDEEKGEDFPEISNCKHFSQYIREIGEQSRADESQPRAEQQGPADKSAALLEWECPALKGQRWDEERDWKELALFFDSYAGITEYLDFLNFEWGLSSGEHNLFNMYGRLYEAMEKAARMRTGDVIVMLDEPDCTFHPEWQQKLIGSLQSFFCTLYPSFQIHLILTTHSPVMLSAIPREKVIFIRKMGEQPPQVEQDHCQTFAANIATLYYDSFFMENGSIADVASRQIAAIFSALNETVKEEPIQEEERGIDSLAERRRRVSERYLTSLGRACDQNADRTIAGMRRVIASVGEELWRYKLGQTMDTCLSDQVEDQHNQELAGYIRQLRKEYGEGAVKEILNLIKGRIDHDSY